MEWELLAAIGTEHHRTERVLMWYDEGDISLSVAEYLLAAAKLADPDWRLCVEQARTRHENRPGLNLADYGEYLKEVYGDYIKETHSRADRSAFINAMAAWLPPSPDPNGPFFGVDRHPESLKSGVALKIEAEARQRQLIAERTVSVYGLTFDGGGHLKPLTASSQPSGVQTTDTPCETAEVPQQPHRASKQGPCCPNCGKTAAPEHVTPLQNSHTVSVQCWWCESRWEEEA